MIDSLGFGTDEKTEKQLHSHSSYDLLALLVVSEHITLISILSEIVANSF